MLAVSNFTDDEIVALLKQIRSTPMSVILDQVADERARIEDEYGSQQVVSTPESVVLSDDKMSQEMTAQIERLLIQEAGLTKASAASALERALHRRHPETKGPSFNAKDGFARWLKQLSVDFSLSEILHAAAAIRNSQVHGRGDDWLTKR